MSFTYVPFHTNDELIDKEIFLKMNGLERVQETEKQKKT